MTSLKTTLNIDNEIRLTRILINDEKMKETCENLPTLLRLTERPPLLEVHCFVDGREGAAIGAQLAPLQDEKDEWYLMPSGSINDQ